MGLIDTLPRPEMMAIGDSLYNGVRSLTIHDKLAQLSAPALVAEGLGIRPRFTCPDYGRPMLIDFEKYLHMFPDIGKIMADIFKNFSYWITAPVPASGLATFDNLSIASTVYRDLITRTAATAEAELAALDAGRIKDAGGVTANLGELYFALNTRFILNPRSLQELMDKTALDIVALRRPRTLLVNIGSNDGLWAMGFDCAVDRRYGPTRGDLDALIERLAALPDDIQIYFNGLALPSTVANLMPTDYYATANRPPPGGYYDKYENAFSLGSYGTINRDQMAALDADVRDHNAYTQSRIAGTKQSRFHFVDVAAVLVGMNAKHEADTEANGLRMADGRRFSNLMLEAAPWPFPSFRSGGLQSLDGMHLSTLGYGLMAQAVLDAMDSGIALNLEAIYQRDTLLQRVPRSWAFALWAWRDIRQARAEGKSDPSTVGHEEEAVRALMDSTARFKVS